jgi:class 3 adenylate cyclase/tetratricopeptide (TPR) repeat protein
MPRMEQATPNAPLACSSCGHPNREGARFCGGCGANLEVPKPCPSCGSENPAGQRFCDECGSKLEAQDGAAPASAAAFTPTPVELPEHLSRKIRDQAAGLAGERKQVTVLFADVMGSMELAERLDPEQWRRIMERFFAILCEGVHRFEGTVDKFTGDGIMALFGAPIAHEDHAQRACYAALHLQEQLVSHAAEIRQEHGLNFSVRMGLNSGDVVVGSIGADMTMEYTAIGHTVGLAQRMEQLAAPGTAYLTEHTASLVEGYLALNDLGESKVKGASQPLGVFELTGIGGARGRLDISRARGFSSFVGRTDELRALEDALEQGAAGRPQVIGIVADAGVGKSRLCDVFMQRCRARGMSIYHTSGQAHATSIPLLPVLQLMRDYFDVTELDSDQTARERIAGKLLLLDESFGEDLPLIFEFLAVPDPERPPPHMDPEVRQRQLLAVTKRLIRAQGNRDPGVTVFEDLHWLDPASEAFLENHVEATQGTRSLTVLNFRPEYRAPWMSKSYYHQIALAPLGPEELEQMLGDLLGSDPSLDGLSDVISERTAGNPFFTEEVVRALVEDGSLEGERGAYRLVGPVEQASVPASVQAVLSARIDRLGEREKAVLQAAAVIGKEFPGPVLAQVAGLEPAALDQALRELVTAEFIFEQELYPEAIYAFKHPLTQEVAYGSQLGERRSAVHAAVARAIAEQNPERADEQAALLAQHWESAGDTIEAARWNARAGAWAGTKDPAASLEHWQKVRELADTLPDSEEMAALGLAARIFSLTYGWRLGMSKEESDALYADGMRIATEEDDLASQSILLSLQGGILNSRDGQAHEYARLARESIALAEQTGDPGLYLNVALSSYAFYQTGEYEEALAFVERAIELADGDPSVGAGVNVGCPLAYCYGFKGGFLCDMGRLAEARELIDRGMKLAAEQGDLEMVGWSHMWGAWHAYFSGEPEQAAAHAQQSLDIGERMGGSFSRAWSWQWMGTAARMQRNWPQAIEALERSLAIRRESGTAADAEGHCIYGLGEAYAGLGEMERGVGLARDGVALLRSHGQVGEALGNVILARVLLASEDVDREEVESVLARASELVRDKGILGLEPLIHVELAELARQSGDEPERERELREAHRLFTEIGATGHARRLAGELSTPAG